VVSTDRSAMKTYNIYNIDMKPVALLLLIALLLPLSLKAQDGQAQVNIITDSGITLILFPAIPGPNQQVMATLESSTLDLDTSTISWSVNGTIMKKALGEKRFSFSTGALGSRLLVTATINSTNGTFSKSEVINVGSVDLLWQGGGYTAPFYKGKAMWGNQTPLSLLAIPSVGRAASSLIYKWSVNGKVLANSSGVGKNSLTIADSILGLARTVKVDVLRDQDTVLATASLSLTPSSPNVLVYELNPLYGYLFQDEISDTYKMREKEVTFAAFPFFFSTPSRSDANMEYSWRTNSGTAETKSLSTYRAPENAEGSSNVSLTVTNPVKITQSASKKFQVEFDNKGGI
jgi:hypothetical protein